MNRAGGIASAVAVMALAGCSFVLSGEEHQWARDAAGRDAGDTDSGRTPPDAGMDGGGAGRDADTDSGRTQCSPDLSAPEHGSVDRTSGATGDVATYSCDAGYTLSGSATRTCQPTGAWSGTEPACMPEPCTPGAPELCDGIDNDCSSGGGADAAEDADGDLHSPPGAACSGGFPKDDCDDDDATIYPGAPELCDGLDNDCSSGGGAVTAEDADGDLHAPAGTAICSGGFPRDDCDDDDATIYPGAPELCDRIDQDCSAGGGVELGEDADGDLHSPPGAACSGGYPKDDCRDDDATIYPGAPELCDGLDNDCSSGGGAVSAEDADGDLHSAPGAACTGGYPRDDCRDGDATIYPSAPELCDRIDQDCSAGGGVELGEDADGDLHSALGAACSGGFPRGDCDDADPLIYPGALPLPPRLLGPENGALTGSFRAAGTLRPLFRWAAPASCGGLTHEIEVDGSCTTPGFAICTFPSPESSATGLASPSHRPASDLPVSASAPVGRRYYWRVRSCDGATCSAWSPVRYLDVGRVPSDVNGDGYADLVVGAPHQDAGATDEGNAFVYHGSASGVPASPSATLDNPANQASGWFGHSVASAGDVNGDGYADLVVGACRQDAPTTDEGNAFVYYGSASGVPASPSATLDNPANQVGGEFGYSVASAGDVNGDGYADLVVGAYRQDAGATDEGNAFVYHGSASGVPASPSATLDNPANQASGKFGISVAPAGDVNGDGYADLVVGAYAQDAGASDEGNAFVYHGSASGVPASPSATLDNPANQAAGYFGYSVASAGDVNGDGYADLVVGAPYQNAGANDEGNAFVYHGSASGVPASPSASLDNPANQAEGRFGWSVASAGDVNDDGYADLVVGAHFQDAGATDEGNAFVYHGSASGVPASPSATLDNPANHTGGQFGISVASAGDVNGDGYADLVVGAYRQTAGATAEGNAFVYHGSASGVPASPSATLDNPANQVGGEFGYSVACAGDVDGDGYADLVVGASNQDAGAVNEDNAFVYNGSASGVPASPSATLDNPANEADGFFGSSVASAGDVNGDGYADLVVGAFQQDAGNAFVDHGSALGVPASPNATLDNPANQASGLFGGSVASAGDVNGDGDADLVVGAHWQDAGATGEGNAFV